jgi:hypothetical protein
VAAKKNFKKKLQRLFSPIKTRVFERNNFCFCGVIHRWEQQGGEQLIRSQYWMAQTMREPLFLDLSKHPHLSSGRDRLGRDLTK